MEKHLLTLLFRTNKKLLCLHSTLNCSWLYNSYPSTLNLVYFGAVDFSPHPGGWWLLPLKKKALSLMQGPVLTKSTACNVSSALRQVIHGTGLICSHKRPLPRQFRIISCTALDFEIFVYLGQKQCWQNCIGGSWVCIYLNAALCSVQFINLPEWRFPSIGWGTEAKSIK